MEIPEELLKQYGSNGEKLYKRGHKDGKLEGAKVAKSQFATEVNNIVNSILKGKEKVGYTAPNTNEVGKVCNKVFKFDGETPDRNALKRLAITALRCMEGMELPAKKVRPPTPKAK